jgi:hypothetical protein
MSSVALNERREFWQNFDFQYTSTHPGLRPMRRNTWELPHWMPWLGGVLVANGYTDLGVVDLYSVPQLSADLDYAIDADLLARLTARRGIESATGPAGSILLFDSRIVHGSGTNMSPHPRGVVLVTYNRTDNALPDRAAPRPEFLAARDATALVPLPDGFELTQPA